MYEQDLRTAKGVQQFIAKKVVWVSGDGSKVIRDESFPIANVKNSNLSVTVAKETKMKEKGHFQERVVHFLKKICFLSSTGQRQVNLIK